MRAPAVILALAALAACPLAAEQGRFLRLCWFEPGIEHGNPMPDRRFRVNSHQAVLHPSFGLRSEARSSGMLQIRMDERLLSLRGAELYLELWGGHPGTANKRVTPNGRTLYPIQENGAAAEHCTHQYPTIPLSLTDLVSGYNALQFACDQGSSFWGHYIVENAALRAELGPGHPDLKAAGLAGCVFEARAERRGERIGLRLDAAPACLGQVERADYQGFYSGYAENGETAQTFWHGFTRKREPVDWLGSASAAPFLADWDVSMLPSQNAMRVRATVRFRGRPELIYVTAPVEGLFTPPDRRARVKIFHVTNLPAPFWSRANRKISAAIDIDEDPGAIDRAVLRVVTWDGGRGNIRDYFTLNGHAFEVAGSGRHDVISSALPVDVGLLRKGANRIELLSDTEHHGIEVLRPGPALVVRFKDKAR